MKRENTSRRLKQLMEERNLRQVDLLNLILPLCNKYHIKMNKSDISQYVSGKNEPSQEKLVMLGMALHVSEAWLMGFDVPMERNSSYFLDSSEEIHELLDYYHRLNHTGQKEAIKRIKELSHLEIYTGKEEEPSNLILAAHECKDATKEGIEEDIALIKHRLKKLERRNSFELPGTHS